MFAYEVPSVTNGIEKKVDLISYEQHQFDWAKDYLLEGSLESAQNDVGTGLIVYEQQNTIQIGDTVTLNISGQKKKFKSWEHYLTVHFIVLQVLEQLSVQRIHLSKLLVNQSTRLLMCS